MRCCVRGGAGRLLPSTPRPAGHNAPPESCLYPCFVRLSEFPDLSLAAHASLAKLHESTLPLTRGAGLSLGPPQGGRCLHALLGLPRGVPVDPPCLSGAGSCGSAPARASLAVGRGPVDPPRPEPPSLWGGVLWICPGSEPPSLWGGVLWIRPSPSLPRCGAGSCGSAPARASLAVGRGPVDPPRPEPPSLWGGVLWIRPGPSLPRCGAGSYGSALAQASLAVGRGPVDPPRLRSSLAAR